MKDLNKIKQLLKEHREVLRLETGIICHIQDEQYEILQVDSVMPIFNPGDSFPLKDTYCAAVCETDDVITYTNVGKIQEMQLHPVYVLLQLESYIGVPIRCKGETCGTLNFSSTDIREQAFTEQEIKQVTELARIIEGLLDWA